MKMKKLYEFFIMFTDALGKEYKDVFIEIDEKLEPARQLQIKSLSVESPGFNRKELFDKAPVTVSPQVYFWLRNALTKNIKTSSGATVVLELAFRGSEYIITYNETGNDYPPELYGKLTLNNIDKILMYSVILDTNKQTKEEFLKDILDDLFITGYSIEKLPLNMIKYYDIVNGVKTSTITPIDASLSTLKSQLEEKTSEFNKHKKVLDDFSAELNIKDTELKKIQSTKSVNQGKSRDASQIREDIHSLLKVKNEISTIFNEITETIKAIDSAIADEIGKDYPNETSLRIFKEKKQSFKDSLVSYQLKLDQTDNDILNLNNSLKSIENSTEQVNDIQAANLTKEITELKSKIESCVSILNTLMSERDVLKNQVHAEETKLGDIQSLDRVNFTDVMNFLKNSLYISTEKLVVYNFLFSLMVYYMRDETDTDALSKTISIIRKIFSL